MNWNIVLSWKNLACSSLSSESDKYQLPSSSCVNSSLIDWEVSGLKSLPRFIPGYKLVKDL